MTLSITTLCIQCCYAHYHDLFIVMLNGIILSVIMLNAIMLSFVLVNGGKAFHPSLMFASKAGAYPSQALFRCSALD
jgi:hypothetical protein